MQAEGLGKDYATQYKYIIFYDLIPASSLQWKVQYKRDFIGVEALSAIIHEKIGYRTKQTHQMASCLLALVAFHKVADSISAPHSSTCRFWFMTTVVTYSRPFLSKPGVSHPDNSFCWLKVPRTKVCGWVQEGTV